MRSMRSMRSMGNVRNVRSVRIRVRPCTRERACVNAHVQVYAIEWVHEWVHK